jgi:protein phosphatase
MVPETRISEIVRESSGDPERTSRSLLSAALDAGGNDNVTVVVVDVREQAERKEPAAREERRSGGTREMPAVAPPASTPSFGQTSDAIPTSGSRGARTRYRPPKTARRKRRSGGFGKALGKLVRGLAVILVVLVALLPAYLWGSSRYFLGVTDGEVVAYRGLPYAPLGVELNEEWRRTGVELSEVETPYRGPIENHRLYTQDEIEPVIRDLGR